MCPASCSPLGTGIRRQLVVVINSDDDDGTDTNIDIDGDTNIDIDGDGDDGTAAANSHRPSQRRNYRLDQFDERSACT